MNEQVEKLQTGKTFPQIGQHMEVTAMKHAGGEKTRETIESLRDRTKMQSVPDSVSRLNVMV